MCRGPLAYGHATATRIDCGVRFSEVFLRLDRGLGHLTEHVFVQRAPHGDRRASPPTHHSERAQAEAHEREAEEPNPRTIVVTRGGAFARLPRNSPERSSHGGGRGAPNRRLLRGERARPPLPRPSRSRGGALPPYNWNARPLHRAGRPGGARCGRGRPGCSSGPRGSSSRRGHRRRMRGGPRCHRRPRRRLGLPRGGSRRLHRCGLGSRSRIRGAALAGRKQGQRVEVPVRLGGQPNAEVHRGHSPFLAPELGCCDHVALHDGCANAHAEGAEMQERDRVAVLGPQGDRPAAAGNRSRERDHARDRSEDVLSRSRGDLDAAMLPGGVGIVVDVEGSEHRAGHGPAPRRRGGRRCEGSDDRRQGRPASTSVVSSENHAATVSGRAAVVKIVYSELR
jgi:hypothetical protein